MTYHLTAKDTEEQAHLEKKWHNQANYQFCMLTNLIRQINQNFNLKSKQILKYFLNFGQIKPSSNSSKTSHDGAIL